MWTSAAHAELARERWRAVYQSVLRVEMDKAQGRDGIACAQPIRRPQEAESTSLIGRVVARPLAVLAVRCSVIDPADRRSL